MITAILLLYDRTMIFLRPSDIQVRCRRPLSSNGSFLMVITATNPNIIPRFRTYGKPSTFLLDSVRSCSQGMLHMLSQGLKVSSSCQTTYPFFSALAYHIFLLYFSSCHSQNPAPVFASQTLANEAFVLNIQPMIQAFGITELTSIPNEILSSAIMRAFNFPW